MFLSQQMVFTQIMDSKGGLGVSRFFLEPIGSPLEDRNRACKSTEI